MKRTSIILAASLVLVLALTAGAQAALPKKGGLYTATNKSNTNTLVAWINVQVRKDGKSARVSWSCNNTPPPTYLTFKINADGTFKGVSNPSGHYVLWSIRGRFVSPTQAKVYLALIVVCSGRGIHTTLDLKQ